MDREPTHRDAIAAIGSNELALLKETADGPALARLSGHLAVLIACGLLILLAENSALWCIAILVYGITIIFFFSLEHESIHGTAFRSPWLNAVVAEMTGFLVLLPPRYFRYFHFAHHRHTQDPTQDPELATPKPNNWTSYLFYLSGFPYWRDAVSGLLRHASGHAEEDFIPANGRAKVVAEARAYLAVLAALAAASLWFGWIWPLELWVIPVLAGQPFLRAYLLAEHAACPLIADMLVNSRTTYTNAAIRFLAWNMPYHSAHHSLPTVPFHRLPDLNAILRDRLKSTACGYREAHRQIRSGFASRS